MPYTIYIIVVVGWILAVLQTMMAAPLWAVMHVTPDRSFVGSQKQGYLLFLSLFMRPSLALVGLFAAFVAIDPIVSFVTNAFFAMKGQIMAASGFMGAVSSFGTMSDWFLLL